MGKIEIQGQSIKFGQEVKGTIVRFVIPVKALNQARFRAKAGIQYSGCYGLPFPLERQSFELEMCQRRWLNGKILEVFR